MCRYVRLNALNVPHVPRPRFIAPKNNDKNYVQNYNSDQNYFCAKLSQIFHNAIVNLYCLVKFYNFFLRPFVCVCVSNEQSKIRFAKTSVQVDMVQRKLICSAKRLAKV